jgi:gliding motility-associated-like protein
MVFGKICWFYLLLIILFCSIPKPAHSFEPYSTKTFKKWISFSAGAGEYAEFSASQYLRPDPDLTMECWIRLNNNNPQPFQHIFGNCWNPAGGLESNWGFGFALLNNRIGFHVIINGTPTRQYEISNPADTFSVCQWYHIAAVKKGRDAFFYVNGELRASLLLPAGNIRSFDGPAHLGTNYASGYNNWFSGNIDELRVWSIARTQEEIRSGMNDTLTGNETGLNAYFKFNEAGAGDGLELKNSAITTGDAIKGIIRSTNASSPFLNDAETLPFPSPPETSFNSQICLSPGSYEISAASPGNPAVRYFWYSASGTDTNQIAGVNGPLLTSPLISQTDSFYVSVLNTQNFCMSSKRAITVRICSPEDHTLWFPNLLTRNGDMQNEFFEIRNLEKHPPGKLSIFTRWGEKVFQTDHYRNDWQGESGHYFYVFSNEKIKVQDWLFVSGK